MQLPVDPARYGAFLGVMAVMAVTPGPANLFAIATGAQKGKAAALVGVAGMNTATLVWFAAAALGLGALILAFPDLFHLLAYAGAAYIAWLGVKSLRGAFAKEAEPGHGTFKQGKSAYLDGFTVQIANPKAVLFFTAVLPPFLDPARPLPAQLAAFACATLTLDILAMSAYGLGGAALAAKMTEPRFARGFAVAVGLLLLTAAVLMARKAGGA
ncbi:threonine/homoserine/homoserine lactone efflux protein [Phenylobacterium haematophilum]|jgi:threonine/homoserine/homoserine lactone efflux protein|uniref:Threonine/homoserine/homoserine lactone efflux protein n=1 Tax=Phenylobacterium haematophilum TaxID=98513 RepID=A0A840A5M5_9CAUL|nr:LysE family translocator [Phenylobacterium haematophilum]MBB3892771.1 threonine/homoserine/homoserine lactone efflux protein [Phenylobacterium haematophilum]